MVITPQNPLAHAEEGSNIMLIPSVERVEEPVLAWSQAQVSPIRENITPPANDKIFSFGNSEMRSVSLDSVDIAQEGIESETFEKSIAETQKEVNKMIHPKEFIEKSIADIDVMIGDINTARDSKIIEAEEYGEEKDRIAALEKDAYTEATTLDEEKSHALHVRELLSGELTRGIGTLYAPSAPTNPVPMTPVSEIADALFGLIEAPADREMETPSILESTGVQSGSVETTMTELAVQNTVTATIEPRTEEIGKEEESPHTQKSKKKEEVALA